MTLSVTPIELNVNPRFDLMGDKQTGYLIENLLTDIEFDCLVKFWEQSHTHGFDWDKTVYYFKGKAHATANQRTFNSHYDRVLFDLSRSDDWHYQTSKTISDWEKHQLALNVHPRINQLIHKIKTLMPFNQHSPDKWITTRGLINVLIYDQLLTYHFDSDTAIFNCPMNDVNQYSITIYLNEVSRGGEFWVDSDPPFLLQPKANSAFVFNGGKALHGVNMNKDHERRTRKAVTFRFAHIDSLLLPGSPDKFLYKIPNLSKIIK